MYINFCLQVHLKVSAARFSSHYLPPESTTPVANLLPVSLTPAQLANLPSVSLIPAAICHSCHWHRWQICHRCRWHRWCTLTCKYLPEFSKKFEMNLLFFSGAWGKVIHEKNLKQKISWHCPLKESKCKKLTIDTKYTINAVRVPYKALDFSEGP
jgi:hypothetical protein